MEIGAPNTAAADFGSYRTAKPEPRIAAAATEFEAVFIAQMLAPLFSSVDTPAIAGGGKSEAFFKSLLQESYAKAMAERGGFGLADHVKSSLISLQSAAQGDVAARSLP
jgi:Rod binding domain-containing protein